MEQKKRLRPISSDSQRKIPNVNRIEIEKTMSQLIAQVVSLWTKNSGLQFDERRELTVKICRLLLGMLTG